MITPTARTGRGVAEIVPTFRSGITGRTACEQSEAQNQRKPRQDFILFSHTLPQIC